MYRTLYVLVYPSRLFAAHWSLWLPYTLPDGQESNVGDRIHATGDRLNGFSYEYIRQYDPSLDDRHPNSFPIGLVSDSHLVDLDADMEKNSALHTDQAAVPFNAFDAACREVEAPGPSLNQVSSSTAANGDQGPPKRKEVKDCQWWIKEVVGHLAGKGLVTPLEGEGEGRLQHFATLIESLPRH